MAYGGFKDLPRRTACDKIIGDKAFDIAKNLKYDRYQKGLTSMVYKFFDKQSSGGAVKNEDILEQQLAEKLHKPIIRKFEKQKDHLSLTDNIWSADLADIQLISKCDKGFWSLLCAINIHSKYAWVVPLKDKKGITVTNTFQTFLYESGCKPNEI